MHLTDLHAAFTGSLSYLTTVVVGDTDPRPAMPAAALMNRPDLAGLLTSRAGDDAALPARRAAVSLWSHYYFATVTVPVIAAAILGRCRLTSAWEACHVVLGKAGQPAGLRLTADQATLLPAEDPLAVIDGLIDGHLMPAVDRMAACGRVSPKLLWCNAASMMVWAANTAAGIRGDAALGDAARHHLLDQPAHAGGRPNPMYGSLLRRPPAEIRAGESAHCRKVCCLRYLLDGFGDCGSLCPLPGRARTAPDA